MPAKNSPPLPAHPDTAELQRLREELRATKKSLQAIIQQREATNAALNRVNKELEAQIAARTRLESELVNISEREKRHFGQDLHDETCQGLAGLSLFARVIARELGESSPVQEKMQLLSDQLHGLVEQTRRIASGLLPISLSGGLAPVLRELAARIDLRLPCTLKVDETIIVSETEALALYRIAQESANNALRHAQASKIEINLERTQRGVALSIRDDGIGLEPDAPRTGAMGLEIMRCRATSVAAELQVQPHKDGGTEVRCTLAGPSSPPGTGRPGKRKPGHPG